MLMHAVKDVSPVAHATRADVGPSPTSTFEDPLDEDGASDATMTATRRGLVRVALIAAETATRFQREDVALDPMAWMMAPRRMFGGRSAVEACLERGPCVRALLLHGLGMELDADPDELDELASDELDAEDGDEGDDAPLASVGSADGLDAGLPAAQLKLFTSTAVEETEEGWVHVFHAAVTDSREEARARMGRSHGRRVAEAAERVLGFHADQPLAQALVSPALADMLVQVERNPGSPLARGLQISIEQRFES